MVMIINFYSTENRSAKDAGINDGMSSNHNIHKCLSDLGFWPSDPLIDRFL